MLQLCKSNEDVLRGAMVQAARHRKRKVLSQGDLAKQANIKGGQPRISSFENATKPLSKKQLADVGKVLVSYGIDARMLKHPLRPFEEDVPSAVRNADKLTALQEHLAELQEQVAGLQARIEELAREQ